MAYVRAASPYSVPTVLVGGSDSGIVGSLATATIIENNGIVQIGDVLQGVVSTDNATSVAVVKRISGVGNNVIGVCVGFGRANGAEVVRDAGTTDTVTVGATNETAAKIFAIIDVTPGAVWSAPLVAGTTTTTVFPRWGMFYDPGTTTNAGKVAETTGVTDSATLSLACLGVDPTAPTTRLLVVFTKTVLNGLHS